MVHDRGTVGAGEIAEAVSDPKRAKVFAERIGDLIRQNPPTNERVRARVCARALRDTELGKTNHTFS